MVEVHKATPFHSFAKEFQVNLSKMFCCALKYLFELQGRSNYQTRFRQASKPPAKNLRNFFHEYKLPNHVRQWK